MVKKLLTKAKEIVTRKQEARLSTSLRRQAQRKARKYVMWGTISTGGTVTIRSLQTTDMRPTKRTPLAAKSEHCCARNNSCSNLLVASSCSWSLMFVATAWRH